MGAAQWWGGCVGAQRHGGALGRSVWLYRGAVRRCAGAQRGAAQGRSSVGLRRGAAWGRGGARRGAVQERSSVGLRRGAASGGAVVGGRAEAHHGAAYGRGAELRRCAAAWGCAKVLYVAA